MENSKTTVARTPWPVHAEDELAAVQQVLASGRTNYWTGEEGRAFEREYASHLGRRHAVAVHNGTLALELALVALGVGAGDEVITTARTFIASASAIVMRGAVPVIADVNHESGNLTADTVAPLVSTRTKAVIAVHMGGWPVDVEPLLDLCRSHGLAMIEDCAQAHGATYRGRPVGSFGEFAAFSFCQDKILSTGGEGGLLALDEDRWWRTAWAFKDHGKSFEAVYEREHAPGFRWVHESFGSNWRMLEVQAAIGRRQLLRLTDWHRRRHEIGQAYGHGFENVPGLRVPNVPNHMRHAYYRMYAYVRPESLRSGWSRQRVVEAIAAAGVPCYSGGSPEIYLERAFVDRGYGPTERLPVARQLGETSIAFLCHPTMTNDDVERAVDVVQRVFEDATR